MSRNPIRRLFAVLAISSAVLATGSGIALADEPSTTTPASTTSEAPAPETTAPETTEPTQAPVEPTTPPAEQTTDAPETTTVPDPTTTAPEPPAQQTEDAPEVTQQQTVPETSQAPADDNSEAPAATTVVTDESTTDTDVTPAAITPEQIANPQASCDQQQSANGIVLSLDYSNAVVGDRHQLDSSSGLFEFDNLGGGANRILATDADTQVFYGSGIPATVPTFTVTLRNTTAEPDTLSAPLLVNNPCFTTQPPVQQAPTVDLTADKATITLGESFNLSHVASENTDTLVASNAWTGNKAIPSGSETVTPTAAGTFTYELTATNEAGSSKDSVTVTVNPVLVPPTGDCSSEIDSAAFVVTYPSVSYEISTLLPACEDLVAYGDTYTLPDSYDGNGFNATATPQQVIQSARVVLTIEKGDTLATATGSLASACGKFVQVDVYTGPQQDTVTESGSNGFLVGGITTTPLPACDVVTPPVPPVTPPVTPVPPVVTPVPVTMIPVNGTPSHPATPAASAPVVVSAPAPVSNVHPGIATAHAGDSASSPVDMVKVTGLGILAGLLALAAVFVLTGRKPFGRKAQHRA